VVVIEVLGKIIAQQVRRFEWIIPPKTRMDLKANNLNPSSYKNTKSNIALNL
jgi:hypothetical protein